MLGEGNTKTKICLELGIARETLNTYLLLKEPPITDSKCIIDNYMAQIKKIIVGKKTKAIYEAMKKQGYKGKQTVLNMHMKSIRKQIKNNTTYLKRSKVKLLFFYDIENIKNETLKNDIAFYLDQNSELSNIIQLEHEFKKIIFSKKPEELDLWIEKVKLLDIEELNSFIKLIEGDKDAVKNAIIYDYSNGLTEGFNNKTKVIKRQMYSRYVVSRSTPS